jgi:hypothetical protein
LREPLPVGLDLTDPQSVAAAARRLGLFGVDAESRSHATVYRLPVLSWALCGLSTVGSFGSAAHARRLEAAIALSGVRGTKADQGHPTHVAPLTRGEDQTQLNCD